MKKHFIPQNLDYLMRQKGLSAARLIVALESDTFKSDKQLSAWREGRTEPGIDHVNELAKFFGLTMEEFCYKNLRNVAQLNNIVTT